MLVHLERMAQMVLPDSSVILDQLVMLVHRDRLVCLAQMVRGVHSASLVRRVPLEPMVLLGCRGHKASMVE
jgi:hypothetical protein